MPPPAFEFRGNRDRRPHNPRHEFTFRYARPATAERPLLRRKRETTPDQLVAPTTSEEQPAMKFAPVENLSDSEEADMDVSSSDNDDASHPRKKRALDSDNKPASEPAPAPPAPKWSNPDPYTVLPPPDESSGKKVDVVKLIRKARNAASAQQQTKKDAVVDNEDFISFGGLVDEEKAQYKPPEGAPSGPRSHGESAVGSRKRTYDDEMKGLSKKTGKPLSKYYSDGSIIDEWKRRPTESGTPWFSQTEASLHLSAR